MSSKKTIKAVYKAVTRPSQAMKYVSRKKREALTFFSYKFLHGYSPFPKYLILYLTHRCNLCCKMCDQWGDTGHNKSLGEDELFQELSLEDLKRVIDDVSPYRPEVTLFGGEPLLCKRWDEVAGYAKKKGLLCTMITNGTLIERNIEKIRTSRIDSVNISIDGPESIHDSIRGGKGIFRQAIKGIQALGTLGDNRPAIRVSCVIMPDNYDKLRSLAEDMQPYPLSSLNFQHLIFTLPGIFKEHNRIFKDLFRRTTRTWKSFINENCIGKVDIDKLTREITAIKTSMKSNFPITFTPGYTVEEIKEYYSNPYFCRRTDTVCSAPWTSIAIMPNGDVTPCLDYVAGNIKKRSFMEIWNNKTMKSFRSNLKKVGRFPLCHRCCV